ncbi:MAG: polysaccharide deacetylase family protein [Oscillospiraceae bacterium]|nr:polysaccharide deacetylase family protein [Oscillospiraceae bacterium]
MNLKRKICCGVLSAASVLCCAVFPASAAGYGQGKECDGQNRPVGAVQFRQQYAESGAYTLSDDSQRIILTFDQGYENGYTRKILDTLRDKNATAIFFLTGDYAKKEPELVRRMIDEGHMLGNHGMKHLAAPTLSAAELEQEIMSLHRYVLDRYGYEMQYFRPPCGEYDEGVLESVRRLGYRTVFWSFAYVDWKTDAQPVPAEALTKLTGAAHGGAIYLLHSVSSANAEILGDLIDSLRAKGFKV